MCPAWKEIRLAFHVKLRSEIYLPVLFIFLLSRGLRAGGLSDYRYYSLADSQAFAGKQAVYKWDKDAWLSPDKGQHLIGSMMSTIAAAKFMQKFHHATKKKSRYVAAGFSLSLGTLKEFHDSFRPHGFFSRKDLAADVMGIFLGMIIISID